VLRPLTNSEGGRDNRILQVQYYKAPKLLFTMDSDIQVDFDTGQHHYSTVSTQIHLKPPAGDSGVLHYQKSGRSVYDSYRVVDSLGCAHVTGYFGDANHITIPLSSADGLLTVDFFPGNPGENMLFKCPDDDKSVRGVTRFWFTGWGIRHGNPGSQGWSLDDWQGSPDGGLLTRSYAGAATDGGISVTENTRFELHLE